MKKIIFIFLISMTFLFSCGRTEYSCDISGHDYKEIVTSPTCQEKGYTTYMCHCGDRYVDDYTDPLGHDIIIDEKVEASCSKNGLTEGEHCTRCEYKIEQIIIEKIEHDEVVTKKVILPTNIKSGTSIQTECSVCGEIIQHQEELPAKGYQWMINDGEIKILMVGNSFTLDAANVGQPDGSSQMFSIIQNMVGSNIKVTLAVIMSGGKGLSWHATKAENNEQVYTLRVISSDKPQWENIKKVSLKEALIWTDWDMVSIQPYNIDSQTQLEKTSYPEEVDEKNNHVEVSLGYLLDYIQTYASQTEVYLYMHWSYSKIRELNTGLSDYNSIGELFQKIKEYYGTETGKRLTSVVPVGLAIQNVRSSYLALLSYNVIGYGNQELTYTIDRQFGLQRDSIHLSFNIGRYLAGLMFAEVLIPKEIRVNSYIIPEIRTTESVGKLPAEYSKVVQEAVHAALETWNQGKYDVNYLEGYEKDPTQIYSELFVETLTFKEKVTIDNVREYLEEKLYTDMLLDELVQVSYTDNIYKFEVTVKFGYTIFSFPIYCLYNN